MNTPECNLRTDPVDRMVKDMKPEETVEWMIEYHGLKESSRQTVVSNLRDQFHWHRLRGRLDRWPAWAALTELLLRRKALTATPKPVQSNTVRSRVSTEKLQSICTTAAQYIPVPHDWSDDKTPRPWGCILGPHEQHPGYCDDCPVSDLCPHPNKEWSK